MSDQTPEPTSTLPEVMKALGVSVGDFKALSAEDRKDLRRWLDEEKAATASNQA